MNATPRRIPGEAGLWVLILGDLCIFTLFFLTFVYYRGGETAVFARSQQTLNRGFGLTNTLLLLTSSLLVATAVHRVRDAGKAATPFFIGAILCGVGFVVIKAFEYGEKFSAGIGFTTNDFFMLYFAFTGIHLVHVLIGLAVLTYLATASRKPEAARRKLVLIESGAIFWHLVDLLWLILFALFYVMQ